MFKYDGTVTQMAKCEVKFATVLPNLNNVNKNVNKDPVAGKAYDFDCLKCDYVECKPCSKENDCKIDDKNRGVENFYQP